MELEVGGVIASRISPVLLEPLVPVGWRPEQGPQPMSPDYGVRLPEGLVTFEVTVWHWEAHAAWHRMNETIHTAFIRADAATRCRGVARNVRIELPLGSLREAVEHLWSQQFCDRVCDTESGMEVSSNGLVPRPIRVGWRPMLYFPDADRIDWAAVAANGGPPFSVGRNIAQTFGFTINPCIDEDDHAAALDSLRKSIDCKKRQCDRSCRTSWSSDRPSLGLPLARTNLRTPGTFSALLSRSGYGQTLVTIGCQECCTTGPIEWPHLAILPTA